MSIVHPNAVAILLSYRRPQNIPRIVHQLALASRVERIVVSNNNPDVDLAPLLTTGPGLTLVQQPLHFRPWKRFDIARQDGAEFFICIDDDLFLGHRQIDQLVEALCREPQWPHGIWGEHLVPSPGGLKIKRGIHGTDTRVDIINRCYCFTKQHATRFFQLAALLGVPQGAQLPLGDDVLLSFAGNGPPRCHNVGSIEECPTSNQPGIAVWTQAEFYPRRGRLLRDLLDLPRDCTEWWAQRMAAVPAASMVNSAT